MENQIQTETSPYVPPVEPVVQTPVFPPTNRLIVILLVLLGIIIVAGLIFVGVQIGKGQTINQQPITVQPTVFPTQVVVNPSATPIPPSPTTIPTAPTIITITTGTTVSPTTGWKTYTKSSKSLGSYSIKYPQHWIVVEKQTEDPKKEQVITTISNTGYIIEFSAFMDGWSPSGCNFDKTVANKPQVADYVSYKAIGNSSIELRRALPPSEYNSVFAWAICTKEGTGDSFSTAFPFSGTITYFTPLNFNEVIINEMDQILSTFKFIE